MSITLPKIKKVLKPFIPITMMLLMGFLLLYQPIAAQSTVTGIISNGSVQGQVPAVNTNNGRTPSFAIERNMVTDTVIISEVRTDQPSTDNDEYFELAGDAGTALDTLTYIVIGDDGSGGSGTIESVTSLSGSIAAGGFYLGVESTFSLTTTADLTATLGFENSDNVTHMLVSNFTGSLGDDIDTDDDGNIDNAPWSALINCIGLVESIGSGDAIYCATTVGPDGIFVPGHAYNCPLSWVIGQFTVGIDDTPRAANSCPAGDLTIGKSGPAIAQPGDTISYTINYDNIGADLADNVVISDTLPPYVSYLSDNSGLSCIACTPGATGTITWSLGTVTPTTPASFVIMTLISDSVPFATTLTNTVTITTTSAELDTDNNDAQWPVSISALDLIVSKSGPQYAIIGDSLVYTIDIDNQGAVTATNVLVTDTLPISVTYVSDDSGWACPACTLGASGTLTWTAGNVPSNTLHFFNLTATVDISAASGLVLTNWVTATTDTVGDQSDNNASSVNTAVYPLVPITTVQFVSNPGNDNDSPLAGQIVWVEGVVTSEPGEIDNPTRFMVIQDPAGGPWSGLPLFRSANFGSAPEGTIVRALGTVQESYGLTQLQMSSDPWALQTIGSTAVPAPAPLLTADYDDSDPDISEQWEGVYLEFAQTPITVTDDSLGYGEWHFDDGSGNARADDLGNRDNNLTYVPVNGDIYTFIRGIGLYSFGNYKLEPRYDADVAIKMTAPELSKSAPYLVLPGSLYTYTLTLNNQIGISLTNVLITDAVPANTTLAYILDGGTESNGIISWTASSLPDQGTIVARFAVTATNGVATAVNDNYAAVSTNYTPTTTGPPVTTYIGDRLHIYHVQGDDFVSPIVGADVTIDGVVVADFQDTTTGMAGFFFQDAAGDGNPATSDGIFVYDDGFGVDVTVGDLVTVTGTVAEFNAQTEINNVTAVTPTTTGATITPTVIVLPETVNGELEQYEGMAVTIPQVMTATQNYFQGRYGQVSMAAGGRLFQPTNIYTPTSAAAIALADENARRMLILDDGQDISPFGDNPNPIPYIGINNTLRAGDTVSGLTGVLDEGRINSSTPPNLDYRLQPTAPVTFTRVNTRSLVHDDVGGNLKVASFNVLNYFTTIDTGAAICGPNMNLGCRGADSAAEFVRQRTKIITAVLDIDADVMGLMEIENNAITATADLVDGLNTIAGAGTYAFIDSGTIGLDAIKVALIYQPANVTPVGITAVLTDVAPFNINTRPPLAQTFMDNASGEQFLVVVNHFKSKGSSCADLGDPNTGDGQGNCNLTRVLAANELTNWLNTDPTATGVTDILIIGDLNSYAQEDPIVTLESAGYTDLIEAFNSAWQYTYVFDGQLGYLDHAMANGSMTAQITGVTQWHINADEPSVIDYNVENKPQDLYSPTAYRASDHDPVIVGLTLQPLLAGFNSNSPVVIGNTSIFTNTTTGPGSITYQWDFGDGVGSSTAVSPTYTYASIGTYTVVLTATGPGGMDVVTGTHVVAPMAVNAAFSSNTPVTLGDTSVFTNMTTGTGPITYTWDFGDGVGTSTDTNPTYTYTSAGTYTITLTATGPGGTDVVTGTHVVVVTSYELYLPVILNTP